MAFVDFTYNPVPAPACYPPDVNGLASLLTSGVLSGTIPDTAGGGIFVGINPPGSALTFKVWFRTDGAGRPMGIYQFYNGNWRKVYTGQLGDIKLYIGPFNGVFDGSGRGIFPASPPYDQDGWAVCNGQNGTPNLEGYFPCGASWNGSAWVANPENTGGVGAGGSRTRLTISAGNLPRLVAHSINAFGGRWQSGGGGDWLDTPPWAYGGAAPEQTYDVPVTDNAHNPTGANTPLPIHLFYAVAYLMFVGYQ